MRLSVVLAAISIAWVGRARCGGVEKLPRVSITLPDSVSAEGVQVASFLSGAFGGYGSLITPKPHGRSYDIDAFVGEVAARRVQAIVYMPGCELSRFDIAMDSVNVTRQIACRKVVQVPMDGVVALDAGRRASLLVVEVEYEVLWAHRFFGIADGPVTMFEVATAPVGEDGSFSVSLPELNEDPAEKSADEDDRGMFRFTLLEKKTGNILGMMAPAEFAAGIDGLALRSWYPGGVRFTLEK